MARVLSSGRIMSTLPTTTFIIFNEETKLFQEFQPTSVQNSEYILLFICFESSIMSMSNE
eukprot:Pgem_evm1s8692